MLTPDEVSAVFGVKPKTVSRWANSGQLKGIRTPGGQWRFHESVVRTLVRDGRAELSVPAPRRAADQTTSGSRRIDI
jgi:excisionase family DNA binding protein